MMWGARKVTLSYVMPVLFKKKRSVRMGKVAFQSLPAVLAHLTYYKLRKYRLGCCEMFFHRRQGYCAQRHHPLPRALFVVLQDVHQLVDPEERRTGYHVELSTVRRLHDLTFRSFHAALPRQFVCFFLNSMYDNSSLAA